MASPTTTTPPPVPSTYIHPRMSRACDHLHFKADVRVERIVLLSSIKFEVVTAVHCIDCGRRLLFDGYLKKDHSKVKAEIE